MAAGSGRCLARLHGAVTVHGARKDAPVTQRQAGPQALPAPQWQAREYRAPQTETEQQLAGLWEELLGQSRVGLDDNFFALGGHSLLATRVVAALRDRWGAVPLRALFEADSLQALAALVDQHNGEAKQQGEDDLAAMADLLDDLEDL